MVLDRNKKTSIDNNKLLLSAFNTFNKNFDVEYGGFKGSRNKFPKPHDYSFLIPQAKEFYALINKYGGKAEILELEGKNHFTVHYEGAASDGEWTNRAIKWIKQH